MIQQSVICASLVFAVLNVQSSLAAETQSAGIQAMLSVAPNGSDENPGTAEKPFQTIKRAREAVRKINAHMTGDIVVVLGGGTYRIEDTIVFGPEDSGTAGYNVIYRAKTGEKPIISGGKPVVEWTPDVNGRWKAPAPVDNFRQLYVGGVRATRARGATPAGIELAGKNGYKTTVVDMANWRNAGDVEFCYSGTWSHSRCRVESIALDHDHAEVTMLQPYFTHARTKAGPHNQVILPAYIENALELLDEPGEWYLDRPAKTVYYLPRPGEDMRTIEVIAPALEKLVALCGTLDKPVRHIRFEGIGFRHGNWLRPSEIGHCEVQANFITDSHRKDSVSLGGFRNRDNENLKSPANVVCHAAKSIRFERCTFAQFGGAGLDIEFGSQDNVISGCCFYDISGTAVQVGDVLKDDHHPDDPRKIVRNNAIVNCFIHDCCVEYTGGVGVFVGYTEGTRIAHNEICRLPYTGVSVGWGWGMQDAGGDGKSQHGQLSFTTPTPAKNNRIENNNIHHVMLLREDGGGIYTLGNQPDTIIRGNYVHDGSWAGIYLDLGSGYLEVAENLVCRISRVKRIAQFPAAKPLHYHNTEQNRLATCKLHDNQLQPRLGGMPADWSDADDPVICQKIIDSAGLEPRYRDLLN